MLGDSYVPIGICMWEKAPALLFCKGLGSCVAMAFYDREKKEGCLVHTLLPYGDQSDNPFYYVNLAVAEVVKRMNKRIADGKIVAKIIGGAKLFPISNKSVGERNIEAAKYWLQYYNIPIIGEDLGGEEGRNVFFNLSSGEVTVVTVKRGVLII